MKARDTTSTPSRTDAQVRLIAAVNSYLKYIVFTIIVTETIFGAIALKTDGGVRAFAMGVMATMLFVALAVVIWFAASRPRVLLGNAEGASDAESEYATFRSELLGAWVETVEPQVPTAVSLVYVRYDPATAGVQLTGTGYGLDGRGVSEWTSEAACINAPARKLFYYWKGRNFAKSDIEALGIAEVKYEDHSNGIKYASGWFSDTSFADIAGPRKRIDFFKLGDTERAAWEDSDPGIRASQVRKVLERRKTAAHAEAVPESVPAA